MAQQTVGPLTWKAGVDPPPDTGPKNLQYYITHDDAGSPRKVIIMISTWPDGTVFGAATATAWKWQHFYDAGYAVISTDYRGGGASDVTVPAIPVFDPNVDSRFPVGVQDVKEFIRFLRNNINGANTYNLTDDFCILGGSAGSAIANIVARTNDTAFRSGDTGTLQTVSDAVSAVINIYGSMNFLSYTPYPTTDGLPTWYDQERYNIGSFMDVSFTADTWAEKDDALRKLSAMSYMNRVKVPTFSIHGDADTTNLPAQATEYETLLDAEGVTNEKHIVPGKGHVIADMFDFAFTDSEFHPVTPTDGKDRMVNFLNTYL